MLTNVTQSWINCMDIVSGLDCEPSYQPPPISTTKNDS